MTTSRRIFLMSVTTVGAALTLPAEAQSAPLDEKSPQATALGYVTDVARVDTKKYAKYAVGQKCSNCVLFQGKADATDGPCTLFVGKTVSAKGWCSAWAKKA